MKRRVAITAAAAIAIIVASLALRSKNRGAGSAQQSSNQPSNEQSKQESPLRDIVDLVSNPSPLIPESIRKSAQERDTKEQFTRAIEGMNRPIDFYGQVVDENSNALPGVKVSVSVRHWDSAASALGGSIPLTAQSDVGGHFHLTGATGDAIGVDSVIKEGYELEPIPHGYGATEGRPEAPIIFKMWNTNIHEQLIAESKSFHIIPDGRKYIINLSNGTIAESGKGDLKVWVKRPDSVGQRDRYDWSCGVEVIDGGLAEDHSTGGAMFYAPTGGYVPSFSFEQKVGSGWGDTTGPKRFYLSLSGGKIYGQMSIELFAYYNKQVPGMVRLNYAINPSGSRILK